MRFPLLGRWEDTETGEVLVERLLVAKTFWHRFVGLQFASPLAADCGLLLRGSRSIHTFWMRFAIDVIFLSVLSHTPSAEDRRLAREEVLTADTPAAGFGNLIWALLNTREFIFIQ